MIKPSSYFDKLNDSNLLVFRNLTSFAFTVCNYPDSSPPFLLETILTVLRGCQKTLTSFKLKCYKFADIEKIVDSICNNVHLKYIRFYRLESLTAAHVIKLAKLNNGNKVLIKIEECSSKITRQDEQDVLSYIIKNNSINEVTFM